MKYQVLNFKAFIFFCITAILSAMLGITFLSYYHKRISAADRDKPAPTIQFSKPSLSMEDIVFSRYEKEKQIFIIKASKLCIQKKKIGFFNFSLLSEMAADNAVIQIFERNPGVPDDEGRPKFDHSVFHQALPFARSKKITSFLMKPVTIAFYKGQSMATQISANFAVLSLNRKEILFRGNVKIVSGNRHLTTEQLTLQPDNLIQINQLFLLKIHGTQTEGNQLTTDIFLNPVAG